ncbi:MAG TPA: SDR family oxidoreductase [Amycolatopsis sp.]|nr:SDR family oxidoreductase [Amycolatopsis sp.]
MSAHEARLDGKTAVVTGAGGVGSAVGALLAARGAKVVFWDVAAGTLRSCVDGLAAEHGPDRVSGIEVDVRDAAAVRAAAVESAQRLGGITILAMCHGVLRTARLLELTEQDWDDVVDTNTKGRFLVSQAVAREMIAARNGGVIVDVGSFTGERIAVGRLHYCAGNAVGEVLTKAMAVDLGKYGIRAVSINSGPIDTPLLGERARDPERLSRFLDNIPLRRLGQPSDVAEAVAFVACDEARYWTGGAIALDGGWMAG